MSLRALLLGLCLAAGGLEDLSAEQHLRRGNHVEPESLDPHRSRGVSVANILRDLFEGLVSEAPDGTLVPGAAQSWEISPDGTIYTFQIRPEARWSNGDPVTARDFEAALRRCADPATGSSYSQVLSPIRSANEVIAGRRPPESLAVQALGERTLLIELVGPTPYFLGLLAHHSTYPVHESQHRSDARGDRSSGAVIGNGAYRLDEWKLQSHVRLSRNPHYWDAAKVAIDRVTYLPTENVASELKRYRAGEIDWTYDVPVTEIGWIRNNLPADLHIGPYLGSYYFGFNLTRPPFLNQPGLRQALAMVIDREVIVEKILATGEAPAYALVPPGTAHYTPQRFDWADWPLEKRLATAKALYAQAGYGPQRPLQVEIRYNTQQDHKRVSIVLASMWKQALGVQTRLVNEEWKVFLQNRRHRSLTQVFRAAWIGDYNDPMTFLELMHSRHGLNDSGYVNPDYDALLARVAVEADAARRQQLQESAERLMLADTPILPVYFYVSRRLVKPYVVGWKPNVMDHHYTRHMRIERRADRL